MGEPMTAEARLRRLRRDQRRVQRDRMARDLAGPLWRQVRGVVPAVFVLAGPLSVRRLIAPREAIIDALRPHGIFALDTAMRLSVGGGCLAGGDVHAYAPADAVEALAEAGLVERAEEPDRVLVRPWPGAPRLFAVAAAQAPPHRTLTDGTRVVTRAHLVRELIGAVGLRFDLLAPLLELEG